MVTDTDTSIEVAGMAALALGMVFVGTAKDGCVEAILQALMSRSEAELTQPFARFLSVGLGLLYLGKQEAVEATFEVSSCPDMCESQARTRGLHGSSQGRWPTSEERLRNDERL